MPFGAAELARLIRNTQVDPAEVVHISAPGGIGYKLGGQLMYELSLGSSLSARAMPAESLPQMPRAPADTLAHLAMVMMRVIV